MTWAVCFNCGEEKFGALCPCPKCGVGSSGDMNLDIAFSTHRMSRKRLRQFGAVVSALRRRCNDERVCFWAFIFYVSEKHPNILKAELPAEFSERARELLAKAEIPEVSRKRWWEFWK
jgi:hypothetical protein